MPSLSSSSRSDRLPPAWWQLKQLGPLGVVILLHTVAILTLLRGWTQPAALSARTEVVAMFITPAKLEVESPAPVSAAPAPAPPVHQVAKPAVVPPAAENSLAPTAVAAAAPVPATENLAAAASAPISPPAAATAAVKPKTLLSGIEYLQTPQPEYPALSRRLGETGEVTLRVLVNEKGSAEQIEIEKSSGSVRLDEAARQALQRAIFKPHLEDGQAVTVYAIAVINFNLNR